MRHLFMKRLAAIVTLCLLIAIVIFALVANRSSGAEGGVGAPPLDLIVSEPG